MFPKFLELFFTPKNTPPKVRNKGNFLGHPVETSDIKKFVPINHYAYNYHLFGLLSRLLIVQFVFIRRTFCTHRRDFI